MQVTIEKAEGLERTMRVVVPSGDVESQVDSKVQETARTIKLKGFRPGKVPTREVRRRFGEDIRQDIAATVIKSSFATAIADEDISPVGLPRIEEVTNEAGRDFEFVATFEVFPEITLASFDRLRVKRPVCQVSDADIDRMIETLRKQRTDYVEVARPSATDDRINIDYEGRLKETPEAKSEEVPEGEVGPGAFPDSTATARHVVIGQGVMMPGFEDALIGLHVDEETTIALTLPSTYPEAFADKKVEFKVKVNAIAEPRLPALGADFFQIFDVTDGRLDTFRAEIKANMTRTLETALQAKLKTRVIESMCEANQFVLPRSAVEQEVDRLRQATVQHLAGLETKFDWRSLPAEHFRERAERGVRWALLTDTIAKQHKLQVDGDRVKRLIDTMASEYDEPGQVVDYILGNTDELEKMRYQVLEQQVIDLVLEKAKGKTVDVTYEEALKPDGEPDAQ